MVIPLLLLIIAITIRVNQYGLTENRYLVIVSALWFTTLIIINIIKRDKFQLTTVTLALSVLLLFSSFGPQGITQLPTNLQMSHLKKILKQNNILVENRIVKNKVPLPFEQAKSVTSSVNYIMRKRKAELFRPYFSDQKAFNKALYCVSGKPCQSRNADALLKLLGVRTINSWQRKSDEIDTNIFLEPLKCCGFNAVKISGYDFLVQINWYGNTMKQKLGSEDELMNSMQWKIQLNGFNLTVSAENQKDVILSLNTLLARFPQGELTKVPRNQKQQLTLLGENDKYQLTLVTERLTINNRDKKRSLQSLKGILYIKIKDISKN